MTIWVFGESFTRHFKKSKYYNHLEDSWVERTRSILDQEVISYAKPSITIEYVFDKFNESRHNIKESDICILSLPYLPRRWFFRKHVLKIHYLDEIEEKAVNNYNTHLNNFSDLHEIYLINFLYNLNTITKRLNLHTIALPSFHDVGNIIDPIKDNFDAIHFSKGNVGEITIMEFKENFLNNDTTAWLQKNDPRVNHLTRKNHIILSNKIVDNVLNKIPIDLTIGFDRHFLDYKLIKDPNFIDDQLFGGIMTRLQKIKVNRPS